MEWSVLQSFRLRLVLLAALVAVSACGDKESPTAPTPPPAPTRIITLEGALAFGDVGIGATETRVIRIYNLGTEALNITGMTSAGAGSVFFADWTQGTIAPGANQAVNFRFTPQAVQTYNGTLTVNGNQTSGTNTMAITAAGVFPDRPLFSRSGAGNTVFDLPPAVSRMLIRGRWTGRDTSNFIVHLDGRGLVNEILRTSMTYEGVHAINNGRTIEIVSSGAIEWSFQEVR
jgi:hypothetical protein